MRSYPNVKYHEGLKIAHRFYTTRAITVKELHLKICEAIERDSVKFSALELFTYSRLWVFEQGDSIEELESQIEADSRNLPIEIHGRILQPHQLIDEINVADDEMILLEWKISFDKQG